MIKHFCDVCHREVPNPDRDMFHTVIFGKDVCSDCMGKVEDFINGKGKTTENKYNTLKSLCKEMFDRETLLRSESMPSRASLAKKMLDDEALSEIKDKIWGELNL